MKIVTAAEIKQLDQQATADFKIPSLLLMENAARGMVDQIERKWGCVADRSVAVLCGSGNNGGDGIAAARHIEMRHGEAIVYLLSPIDKLSGDAKTMLDTWIGIGGKLQVVGSFSFDEMTLILSESDLIIDALLGTGLSHPVHGPYKEAIDCINNVRETYKIPVVSVDIPSGISADTGEMLGAAVHADYTFTMGLPKRGLFLRDGLERRGAWDVVDIGFPKKMIDNAPLKVNLIGLTNLTEETSLSLPRPAEAVRSLPPMGPPSSPRRLNAHKGDFGHLLVIAGSKGKKGAAALTALASLRCGVGLVTVALPQSIDTIAPTVMEAMTLPLLETDEGTLSLQNEKTLIEAANGKKAVAIGPGLSQNRETVQLVINLIHQITAPMIIDADGINALATDLSVLKKRDRATHGAVILTPHPGEMGRLLGVRTDTVQKDRIGIAVEFAKTWDVIVVLKGAHTVIADPNGEVFLSNTGNPGMATAGTGDVLTGMIATALAQGISPIDAAVWGVVLHGLAGDIGCETSGEVSLIATDLIENIPKSIIAVSSPSTTKKGG